MNDKKYAVFLDIDNTLYSGGKVPKINIDTINLVRALGHFVFINTARSYAFIPENILREVPLDGIVAGIGTDLRLGDKRLVSEIMSKPELKKIAEHFMGDSREVAFEGEDIVIWINPEKKRNPEYFLHSPEDFDTVYNDARISKMYIKGHLTDEENILFGKTNIMYQHESYAEFVPKGFGKAVGMLNMLKYIDVPKERCIAMGDSENDRDMLLAAGISVAMGNAVPKIKKICDYVSCDAKDGGVAKALRHYILKEE